VRASTGLIGVWAPVAIYMALIFAGSSISRPPQVGPDVSDKLLHFVVYAGLGVVIVRAISRRWTAPVTARVAVRAALIAAAYGASDEFHQAFVPERDAEVLDLAADAAGAATAAAALWAWDIIRGRNRF
jgi:VanZ family protein